MYVMNADGSGQTRLTNNAASDIPNSWQRILVTTPDPLVPPVIPPADPTSTI
ncbi:MAG: hypothetical protein WKG07_13085 [Hymenobacter sp.]